MIRTLDDILHTLQQLQSRSFLSQVLHHERDAAKIRDLSAQVNDALGIIKVGSLSLSAYVLINVEPAPGQHSSAEPDRNSCKSL